MTNHVQWRDGEPERRKQREKEVADLKARIKELEAELKHATLMAFMKVGCFCGNHFREIKEGNRSDCVMCELEELKAKYNRLMEIVSDCLDCSMMLDKLEQ